MRLTQNRLQETNIRSEIGLELEHKLESPTEEPGAARAELAEPLPVEPAGPADRLRALRREPLSEAGPLPEDWDPKQLWSAVADQIHLPPALSPLPAKSPAPVQSPQIVRPAPDTSGLIEELQLPDPGHLIQPRSPQTAPQRSVPEANPRSASASRFQFPAPAKVVAKKTETLKSQAAADKTGSKEPGQSPGEEVAENAAQGGGSAGGARLAGGGSSSATVSSQNAEAASETSEVAALHRANASTNLGGGSLLAFNQQSAATAQANQSAQAGAAQQREQDHEKAQSARKLEENKDSTKSSNQKQEFEQARKFHQQQQQRQRAGSAPQEPKGQQAQRYRQVQKNEEVKEQLAGTSEDHSQVACARCGFLLGGSADVNCPICSADHNDKIHQMLTQYRLSKDSWVSAVDTVVASPRAQLVLPEVSQAAVELRYIPKIPKFAQLLRTVKE
ncbi:hypothetical protein JST97_25420 [bacterium]|nr:hypothetical protein [bacterium]